MLLTVLKLFAPILPYVTEEIYRHLYAPVEARLVPAHEKATTTAQSIHLSSWPTPEETLEDDGIEAVGDALIEAITAVRRYKTEHGLALSAELARLQLATQEPQVAQALQDGIADITSITRAKQVEIVSHLDLALDAVKTDGVITVALAQGER